MYKLNIYCFDLNLLYFNLLYIYKLSQYYNIKIIIKPQPRQIKKFSLLSSPHVYKSSFDQFEIRTYHRLIFFYGHNKFFFKFIKNLQETMPSCNLSRFVLKKRKKIC